MPHLPTNPAHLGRAASASVEPDFIGPDWFEAYAARHAADGLEGRLVSQFAFSESWDSWEMHPHGAERVICTQGACTLHQEHADGSTETVTLAANATAINRFSGGAATEDVAGWRAPRTPPMSRPSPLAGEGGARRRTAVGGRGGDLHSQIARRAAPPTLSKLR